MSTDIDKYLSFAMTTFLAFGITFEVPVVVIVLVRFGVVELEKLKQIRPYVIVGAFIVAAVVTPPDVMSQLLLAVPLIALYELGLLLARFVTKQPLRHAGAGRKSCGLSSPVLVTEMFLPRPNGRFCTNLGKNAAFVVA